MVAGTFPPLHLIRRKILWVVACTPEGAGREESGCILGRLREIMNVPDLHVLNKIHNPLKFSRVPFGE